MANTKIKIRRSAVGGRIPSTSDLDLGELAINTYDGKIFLKKSISGVESIVGLSNDYNDLTNIPQDLRTTASPSFSGISVTGTSSLTGQTNLNGSATIQTTTSGPQYALKVEGSTTGNILGIKVSDNPSYGVSTDVLTNDLSSYGKYTLNASEINLKIPSTNVTWRFTDDGKLKLPVNGDIVDSSNVSVLNFPTVKRITFDNPIIDYNNLIYTTATDTSSSSNEITVLDTTGLSVDDPVMFFGISFGNLLAYKNYYIKTIPSSTTLTISETLQGSTLALTDGSGNMSMCNMSLTSYQTQRAPRLWTNYDSIQTTGYDFTSITFGDSYYDDASNKIYIYVNFGDGTPQPMDLTPVS